MMIDSNRFDPLVPIIQEICHVSGIPGVSLGVLHQEKVIYTKSFGFADLEEERPCDSDTTFVIGSLSKAITAALLASLIDEGLLSSWDVPLKAILPEFNRSDIYGNITIADLLSHRTGLAALDSLWLASQNIPFLGRSQAVSILNHAPAFEPLRTQFVYNNFCYEVIGQVIEKLSNASFSDVLHSRLSGPLQLTRTYYTGDSRDNEAKPYASLENRSFVRIAPAIKGKDVLMGSAGGIRSSVRDLLALYKSFIKAARDDTTFAFAHEDQLNSPKHTLKDVRHLLQGHISLPSCSLREHSYAFGWARSQLPGVLSVGHNGASKLNPLVGKGAASRLALYHGGSIPGYNTYNAVFPESGSAVVVLTNSLSLNEGVKWIGNLLVEALFNNLQNSPDYCILAKESATKSLQQYRDLHKSLADGCSLEKPMRYLKTYAGSYCNIAGNFFINIVHDETKDILYVSYMGRGADTFQLHPYQNDSFYWSLEYDECVRLARYPENLKEYYILKFGSDETGSSITHLWWKHEENLLDPGEMFNKKIEEGYPVKY